MVIAINWQDPDSSSAKSLRYVFPYSSLSRVMLCGGHVGRLHANNLKDYKGKKSVDLSFVATHKKNYPELETAKCESAGKRAHSKTCGCMSDEFLGRAKSNHFSALKQSGNNSEEYASRMRILGNIIPVTFTSELEMMAKPTDVLGTPSMFVPVATVMGRRGR